MIRKGNSAQLPPKRFRNDLRRSKRSVGEGGMGMQITGIVHGASPPLCGFALSADVSLSLFYIIISQLGKVNRITP